MDAKVFIWLAIFRKFGEQRDQIQQMALSRNQLAIRPDQDRDRLGVRPASPSGLNV